MQEISNRTEYAFSCLKCMLKKCIQFIYGYVSSSFVFRVAGAGFLGKSQGKPNPKPHSRRRSKMKPGVLFQMFYDKSKVLPLIHICFIVKSTCTLTFHPRYFKISSKFQFLINMPLQTYPSALYSVREREYMREISYHVYTNVNRKCITELICEACCLFIRTKAPLMFAYLNKTFPRLQFCKLLTVPLSQLLSPRHVHKI